MSLSSARAALLAVLRNRMTTATATGAASPPFARVEVMATAVLVAVGLLLRSRGMLFGERLELWNDEASWAMRMFERPLAEHLIRPPAYVVLTRFTATLFGYRELGFRMLPWLAGMATPFVALFLSRRFLKSAGARILFVAVICLSASAIDFSKEFKQYAIGLLWQLLLPLLALRWVETRQQRDLIVTCLAAAGGLLFTQDVMFIYPGLFLVLLVEAWRSRARSRRQLVLVVVAGAATVALVAGMYFLIWKRIPKEKSEQHWGGRYDVFYLDAGAKARGKVQGSRGTWLLGKYRDMVAMPGSRRDLWSDEGVLRGDALKRAVEVEPLLWVALHLAGLAALIRMRRYRELLLFWSPLLVCTLLNLAGRWPLGAFRTNLFLLAGTSALAASAFEWLGPSRARLRSLAPAFAIVLLPFLLFVRELHAKKPGAYAAGVLELLKRLETERGADDGRRAPLYMDTQACQPFKYYTLYHPDGKAIWARLGPKMKPVCDRRSADLMKAATKLDSGERAWLLLLNRAGVPKTLKVLSRHDRHKHVLLAVRRR